MLYFKNPAFIAYIHNLVDLHALLILGLNNSPEAEIIRDKSDILWPNLTAEERTELRRINAFLPWIKDSNIYTETRNNEKSMCRDPTK